MNGERHDQSNLVFRYAMPLEFILDHIIRPIPLSNNRNRVKNILSVSMPPMKNRKSITYD